MAHDSQRELQDLTTVNTFYLGLLEKSLGHSVPTPRAIQNGASSHAGEKIVSDYKNWLDLIDLAITPPVVRDTLKPLPALKWPMHCCAIWRKKLRPAPVIATRWIA